MTCPFAVTAPSPGFGSTVPLIAGLTVKACVAREKDGHAERMNLGRDVAVPRESIRRRTVSSKLDEDAAYSCRRIDLFEPPPQIDSDGGGEAHDLTVAALPYS